MRKFINWAFFYAILAMVSGVFYREFTKYQDFTGTTTLSVVHTHLFTLGMMMFLIAALFIKQVPTMESKKLKAFLLTYNIGLLSTVTMLTIRGITQVLNLTLAPAMNSAISGIAGLSHIILAIGIILFFLTIKEATKE